MPTAFLVYQYNYLVRQYLRGEQTETSEPSVSKWMPLKKTGRITNLYGPTYANIWFFLGMIEIRLSSMSFDSRFSFPSLSIILLSSSWLTISPAQISILCFVIWIRLFFDICTRREKSLHLGMLRDWHIHYSETYMLLSIVNTFC